MAATSTLLPTSPDSRLHHHRRYNTTDLNYAAAIAAAKQAQLIATHQQYPPQQQKRTRRTTQNTTQTAHSARMKRPLEVIGNNSDPLQSKRARITVEILARTIPPPTKTVTVKPRQQHVAPVKPIAPPPAQQQQHQQAAKTVTTASQPNPSALTKHQEKVNNGIKHELERLQSGVTDAGSSTRELGRKLRSQEATRFKSELSAYFPDYDEVIGNDPKEQHILNLDTPILVIDSATVNKPLHPHPPHLARSTAPAAPTHTPRHPEYPIRCYPDVLFNDLFDSHRLDFSFLDAQHNGNNSNDPLPDSYFEPAHRKAERLERSIRNTEKGRAQHEKDQIIRLLNELQGHDWLRTMGVSGVTESRKKTFEPAREHFIKGCQAILEKFRLWNLEEKKRRQEKERALAEEAERAEEEDEGEEEEEEGNEEAEEAEEEEEGSEETAAEEEEGEDVEMADAAVDDVDDGASDGDPPDYSDVDAHIARQLSDEAAKYASSKRSPGEPSPEPYVPKEFTSFFRQKHQRDAALNRNRRRGRHALAWGQNVPEVNEEEFWLPEEYRDDETMRSRARSKRRDRRDKK